MANRFIINDREGCTKTITDTKTGVQYLLAYWTSIGGLTVLVDKDGKPLIDEKYSQRESDGGKE